MINSDPGSPISVKWLARCFTLIVLVPFAQQGYSQHTYPEWFLHPGSYPQYVTGYSTAGLLNAEDDAIWRYSLHKQGYLVGEASYFNNEDKWEKDYRIEAQAPMIQNGQLEKIATFLTSPYNGGEGISIFQQKQASDEKVLQFSNETVPPMPPPWIGRGPFFTENEFYYGVGKYVLKGNENDAWRTAEERSIIELSSAIGLGVNHRELKRSMKSTRGHLPGSEETVKILTYSFNHEFSDLQVLERWIDYRDSDPDASIRGYIYVLVRIKSNDIKYHLTGD